MKKYFYVHEGQSNGPFTKEELIGKINPETLVWFEGLTSWIKASEVQELMSVIQIVPPPIPIQDGSQSDKVGIILKREKGNLITPHSEVRTAKELKVIAYLVLASFGIALVGYIWKLQRETSAYVILLNDFNENSGLLSEYEAILKMTAGGGQISPVIDSIATKWFNKNEATVYSLYGRSKRLGCYGDQELGNEGQRMANQFYTIANIENKIKLGYELAMSFSLKIFLISIGALILGRYAIQSIRWVIDRAS